MELSFELGATQSYPNPYTGPGKAGVPKTVFRALETPEKLSRAVRQMLSWRGLALEEAADAAGIEASAAAAIARSGRGSPEDVEAILRALGIRPVALPAPSAMSETGGDPW